MTGKSKTVKQPPIVAKDQHGDRSERSIGQFCSVPNTGIIVDLEVQAGDPVDSQFIRNFMGKFEAANKKQSV